MAAILASVRLLPMEVMTKQFDCCTARRSSGSIVVTLVASPKAEYQSLSRPSSMAMVPNGAWQRSSEALALVLELPAAPPRESLGLLPLVTEPPSMLPAAAHPASAVMEARTSAPRTNFFVNIGIILIRSI